MNGFILVSNGSLIQAFLKKLSVVTMIATTATVLATAYLRSALGFHSAKTHFKNSQVRFSQSVLAADTFILTIPDTLQITRRKSRQIQQSHISQDESKVFETHSKYLK